MREILFRGKLLAGTSAGEWVYGNLVIKPGQIAIITPDDTPIGKYGRVDPDTVGQFTGMMDRSGSGVKIFEGDIVKTREIGQLVIGKTYTGADLIRCGVVEYTSGKFEVIYSSKSPSKYSYEDSLTLDDAVLNYEVIVIGNVHDNLSLLTA